MSGPTPPRDQRVDAVIPVRFADAKEFLVEYTSNISLGGVFVRTANPAAFGTVVRLSLELPGTSQAVPVTGQVAFVLPADQAARQGKVPGMGVRFARLDPAVQETLAAYVEGQQRKSRGRVLLVDDDAVVSQKLADLLRGHHLNVTTVSSAIKALEILRFGGVDFICSDIVMPRMDGFEFRDNVRNNPKTANIPFIFLTSSENAADMQLAAELGVQFFLRKPVEPGPLLALLRQVLGDAAFQPDAPGTVQPPSEEKMQKKKTQDRKVVEIAYKKFVSLGLDTRFTADERGVYGQLQLKTVNIQDPVTGNRLERAGLYSVGHDRVKPFWPRALGALPLFSFLDIPDAPSLEKLLASAFIRRIDGVRQIKTTLDAYKIPNRYDAAGMRMLGQIKSGTDSIVFSVRDPKTLFLESINGRSFGEVAQMRARLVDVADARSGSDVEIALETAFRRLQQTMQEQKTVPAGSTAVGADGRRSVVVATELTADPEAPVPAPSAPPPPAPPAASPNGGAWIGEPEEAQQIAAAAVDLATKAAIAATVGAAARPVLITPPPVEEIAPIAAEEAPAPVEESSLIAAEEAPAPVEESSLIAAEEAAPPVEESAPIAAEEAAPPVEESAPIAAEEAAPPLEESAPIAAEEAAPPVEMAPPEAEPASPEPTAPPPADDIWPESAAPAEPESVPASSASPFGDPADAAPVAAPEAASTDDWSAYAAPDASANDAPPAVGESPAPLTDREAAPGVTPESLTASPDGADAAFGGAEYELAAGANGTSSSAELELAAPEPPAPAAPAVSVQTDFSSLNDMESTVVPRSEPEPENLTPEEKEARDWADEWTGDVATAEPLWTIQPGEDAIKASTTVTDALETPDAAGSAPAEAASAAVPPAASAEPAAAVNTAGMTAMVCTLCASTYHIGDEIDDERLLLVCPSCIAKNLA